MGDDELEIILPETPAATAPAAGGTTTAVRYDQPRGQPFRRNGVDYQQYVRPDGTVYYLNLNTGERLDTLPPQQATLSPAAVQALAGTRPTGALTGGLTPAGPAAVPATTSGVGPVQTGAGQTPVFSLEDIAEAGATPGTSPADIIGQWPAYMTSMPGNEPGGLSILAGGLVGGYDAQGNPVATGMTPIPGTLTTSSPQLTGVQSAGLISGAIISAAGYIPTGDPRQDAQIALAIIQERQEIREDLARRSGRTVDQVSMGEVQSELEGGPGRRGQFSDDYIYWDEQRQQWLQPTAGGPMAAEHAPSGPPQSGQPRVLAKYTSLFSRPRPYGAREEADFPTPEEQYGPPPVVSAAQGAQFRVHEGEMVTITPAAPQPGPPSSPWDAGLPPPPVMWPPYSLPPPRPWEGASASPSPPPGDGSNAPPTPSPPSVEPPPWTPWSSWGPSWPWPPTPPESPWWGSWWGGSASPSPQPGGGGNALPPVGYEPWLYPPPPRTPVPLAEGGLVTQPTAAVVGEAGPEVVLPVERIRQIITQAFQSLMMQRQRPAPLPRVADTRLLGGYMKLLRPPTSSQPMSAVA